MLYYNCSSPVFLNRCYFLYNIIHDETICVSCPCLLWSVCFVVVVFVCWAKRTVSNEWLIYFKQIQDMFSFFVEKIKSLNFIIYLTCYNLLLLFLFFSSRAKENGKELLFMALRLPFQFPVHLWRTIQRTRYTFIFFGLYWIINLHFKFNKWTQFLNSKKERYWQRVYL